MKELNYACKQILEFLKDNSWSTPTKIGMEVLGQNYGKASSYACRQLKELLKLGLVKRKEPGIYNIKS